MAMALAILARLSYKQKAYLNRLGELDLSTLAAPAREAVKAAMSGATRKRLGKI
jgi:hypothetical protein